MTSNDNITTPVDAAFATAAASNAPTNTGRNDNGGIIMEGERYIKIQCEITANTSINVKWTKQFFSKHLMELASKLQQQDDLKEQQLEQTLDINSRNDNLSFDNNNNNDGRIFGYLNTNNMEEKNNNKWMRMKKKRKKVAMSNINNNYLIIDQLTNDNKHMANNGKRELDSSDAYIDWSRSNITQHVWPSNRSLLTSSLDDSIIISELIIDHITYMDSGIYTCLTPNNSKQIEVNVMHKPVLISKLNWPMVAADPGERSIKFTCNALAFPRARFNWTKISSNNERTNVNNEQMINYANVPIEFIHFDDNLLTSKYKYNVIENNSDDDEMMVNMVPSSVGNYHSSSILIIHNINEDDYTGYKCLAYNSLGANQLRFDLVKKSE